MQKPESAPHLEDAPVITPHHIGIAAQTAELLAALGVPPQAFSEGVHRSEGSLKASTPITGETIGALNQSSGADIHASIDRAHTAFLSWRLVPAPRRGALIRLFGDELRGQKAALGKLVSIESGKILSEGLGEVQEMIDICDFAVGLSRQLYGLTIASERPRHRMTETWHPLGVTGIITAFNFPVAVWAWNAAIALVCGNSVVWKPSEKTPLTALAATALFKRAVTRFNAKSGEKGGEAPEGLAELIIGDRTAGEAIVDHPLAALVSATGSTAMGKAVAPHLAGRFARAILELGGNNGAIICPSADLDLALRGVAFAAMGTAGQRCTSLRRLFVHESIYDKFVSRLKAAYGSAPIGDPLNRDVLIGPLIDEAAFEAMQTALEEARSAGGRIFGGERTLADRFPDAFYVRPALVEMPAQTGPVERETFAPILYVIGYRDFSQAIALHNATRQGLSSSIFTNDVREAETFLSVEGSDCGIANVNIGPSGAEIGGAFGGEKETGGGREAGSDAWKAYMRRATNTVNYGSAPPLAQGVSFDINLPDRQTSVNDNFPKR
jgi:aldehyde dehydrogenase (NAD+)